MIRRTVIASLHTAHRVRQLTRIENVCNHNLSAATLEQIAARVPHTDGGSYGPTLGQQLSDNSATGPSGCADNENFRINHEKRSGGILAWGTISYLEAINYWYDIVPNASENVRNQKPKRHSPTPSVQTKPVSSSIRERVL